MLARTLPPVATPSELSPKERQVAREENRRVSDGVAKDEQNRRVKSGARRPAALVSPSAKAASEEFADDWALFHVAAEQVKADRTIEDAMLQTERQSIAGPGELLNDAGARQFLEMPRDREVELAFGTYLARSPKATGADGAQVPRADGFEPGVTPVQFHALKFQLDARSSGATSPLVHREPHPDVYMVEISADNVRRITRKSGKVTFETKERSPVVLDNRVWGYRVTSSRESSFTPTPHDARRFQPTVMREIERYSYWAPLADSPVAGFRIDLSIVKQSEAGEVVGVSHEVEIERYLEELKTKRIDLAPNLRNVLMFVMMLMQGLSVPSLRKIAEMSTGSLLSAQQKQSVMTSINRLLRSNATDGIDDSFVNRPVNLKLGDIRSSVAYAVTSKLDGERRLLYFHEGKVYAFNPPFNLELIGASSAPDGTLIDGELMAGVESSDARDEPFQGVVDRYFAFDLLFFEGKDVQRLALEERLERLRETLVTKGGALEIKSMPMRRRTTLEPKPYFFAKEDGLRDAVRKAFSRNERYNDEGLETDGIVFQPAHMPYRNDFTRKWKEPSQLTIDFVASYDGGDEGTQTLRLYSAVRAKLVPFTASDFSGVVTEDDIQTDGQSALNKVAEYRWTGTTFQAIRLRPDKLFPNNLRAAQSNWEDIVAPIVRETLLGEAASVSGGETLAMIDRMLSEAQQEMIRANAYRAFSSEARTRAAGGAAAISVGLNQELLARMRAVGVSRVFITNQRRRDAELMATDVKLTWLRTSVTDSRTIAARTESTDLRVLYAFDLSKYVPTVEIKGLVDTANSCLVEGGVVMGTFSSDDLPPDTLKSAFESKGYIAKRWGKPLQATLVSSHNLTQLEKTAALKLHSFLFLKRGEEQLVTARDDRSQLDDETIDEQPKGLVEIPDDEEPAREESPKERYKLDVYEGEKEKEKTESNLQVSDLDLFNTLALAEGRTLKLAMLGYRTIITGSLLDASSVVRAFLVATDPTYRKLMEVNARAVATGEARRPELEEAVMKLRNDMAVWLTAAPRGARTTPKASAARFAGLANGAVKRREMQSAININSEAIHRIRNVRLDQLRREQYEQLRKRNLRAGRTMKLTFARFRGEFTEEEDREALDPLVPIGTLADRALISYVGKLQDPDFALGESVLEMLSAITDRTVFVVNAGRLVKLSPGELEHKKAVMLFTTDRVFYYAVGFRSTEGLRYEIDRDRQFKRLWKEAA